VLSVGVAVTVDAVIDVKLNAKGQVLIGASMVIDNFNAKLDALGSGSTVAGFTPKFTPKFDASGQVDASLGLGLPTELGVGLKVPGEYMQNMSTGKPH
jgi:hypothetical protein